MGIDVVGVFERRDGNRWTYVQSYYDGQRGLLRYWLGWGSGWYSTYGVKPIVSSPRGLPTDFRYWDDIYWIDDTKLDPKRVVAVGTQLQSWVGGEEILAALPLLGVRSHSVRSDHTPSPSAALAEWEHVPGISEGHIGRPEAPRLVAVSSERHAETHPRTDALLVNCSWDFSDHIAYFTDDVHTLVSKYGSIRFVYGFE